MDENDRDEDARTESEPIEHQHPTNAASARGHRRPREPIDRTRGVERDAACLRDLGEARAVLAATTIAPLERAV